MKIKVLIITLCLMLVGIGASAQTEYVVKFNDSIQIFGAEENSFAKYTTATADEVQEYLDAGIVEYYEPVMYAKMLGTTNNWQLENIKASFPKKIGSLGNDVKVAVIDSGITAYETLTGRVLPGYDFYEDTTDVTDEFGHGTFVSSMIALEGSGPAHECCIVPLKVFYENEEGNFIAQSGDVAEAIRAAVDTYDCDVINLSLSFSASPQVVVDAIDHAIGKGAIIVAAAGNDGTDVYHYPAAYENVIAVGSTDSDNVVAWFSQRNDRVTVVAPGEGVVVSPDSEKNNTGNGTSFSAPQVSALAAISKCIKPDITNAEFMELVTSTATDLGVTGYDTSYGYGLINCEAFVKKMIEGRKVYISPVKIEDGKASSIVYNNTGSSLSAKSVYICSEKTFDCEIGDISLASDAVTTVEHDYTDGKVQFMVWDSIKQLVPLSPVSSK